MKLRVQSRGCDERVVLIQSAKCTIGSAAGCTLRIHADGVVPLHCWILRGPAGTVVRRLHGSATLNGGRFDEAALVPGDRLRLGSVDVQIVQCNEPLPPPAVLFSPAAGSSFAPGEVAQLKADLAAALEENLRLENQTRQGFQSSITAAERADQLRDALAAAHQQLEDSCRELAAAQEALGRQSAAFDAAQAELQAARSRQADQSLELENIRRELSDSVLRRRELEAGQEQAQGLLASERAQWEAEQRQLARRLEQRDAELAAVRSSASSQTSSMTVMLDEISRDKETVERKYENCRAELEAQLAAARSEIESLKRIVGEQTIIEGRFEKLTRDYDLRCIELQEARNQLTAAEAAGQRAADEAEERGQSLTSWQEELAGREQRLNETLQTLEAERQAVTAQQQRLEEERREIQARLDEAAAAKSEAAFQQERSSAERGEIERLRKEQEAQAVELESRRQQLVAEQARQSAEQTELTAQREALSAQREGLSAQQAEMESQRQQFAAAAEQFAAEKEQLAIQQAQHAERGAARLGSQAEENVPTNAQTICGPESLLAIQSAEVERQLSDAGARLAELERLREQLGAEREANELRAQDLDQRQQDLAELGQQLEARASLLESLRQELDQQAGALAQRLESLAQGPAADCEPARGESSPAMPNSTAMPAATIESGPGCNVTCSWEPIDAAASGASGKLALSMEELPEVAPPVHVDVETPAVATTESPAEVRPDTPVAATLEAPAAMTEQPAQSGDSDDSGNVDSVLSRLVRAGVWREGEAANSAVPASAPAPAGDVLANQSGEDEAESPLAASAESAGEPVAMRDSTGVCGDEESIESYMERLLKRVKGDSAVIASPRPTPPEASATVAPVAAAAVEECPQSATVKPNEAADYSPLRTAPELSTSLTAMRDLANSAARSAIDRHVRKHTGQQAAGKLLGATLTVTTSVVLSYWAWQSHSVPAAVGAGIGGAAGVYWTLTAIRRLFTLMRLNRAARPAQCGESTPAPNP